MENLSDTGEKATGYEIARIPGQGRERQQVTSPCSHTSAIDWAIADMWRVSQKTIPHVNEYLLNSQLWEHSLRGYTLHQVVLKPGSKFDFRPPLFSRERARDRGAAWATSASQPSTVPVAFRRQRGAHISTWVSPNDKVEQAPSPPP